MDVNCETVFLKELQKNKSIILTKENTRSARDKKRLAWMTIQRSLIAASGREYSVQQLCKKWNNLQQRVKEKIRNSGGEKIPKSLHERDLLCLQIIGPENLNLPAGLSGIDLGSLPDFKNESDDGIPDIPMVVNADSGEKKLLDMLVSSISMPHNSISTSHSKNEHNTQLIDVSSQLVSSIANTTTTSMLPISSANTSADVGLQDFDTIQTNIFTELANRINQINGSVSLYSGQEHESSPDITVVEDSDNRQHHLCQKKRKRQLSVSSSSSDTSPKDSEYLQSLKRDILLLKKEKLTLENQKIRLEINRLKKEDRNINKTVDQSRDIFQISSFTQTPNHD